MWLSLLKYIPLKQFGAYKILFVKYNCAQTTASIEHTDGIDTVVTLKDTKLVITHDCWYLSN